MKIWTLLKRTYHEWSKDRAPRLGAALAFYSMFSLAPLFVIAVSVAGVVFGHEAAREQVLEQVSGLVGEGAADSIRGIMAESANKPKTSALASALGLVTLLFGAAGVFGQLQSALNTIWDVTPKPTKTIWQEIRRRFLSFATVLGTGFLLLVSLLLSAGLASLTRFSGKAFGMPDGLLAGFDALISFVVVTIVFATIFRMLPDTQIAWREVWIGAAMTSLLFTLGKSLIGLYLGRSTVASSYGAAGSMVVVLLWVYYSTQILLFGAEFTHVYATRK